jgi:hypothetical protein
MPCWGQGGELADRVGRRPFSVFMTTYVQEIEAVTDRGRAIPLFHFDAAVFPYRGQQIDPHSEEQQREFLRLTEEALLIETKQDPAKLIRAVEPHLGSNCHGWVFAAGRYGITNLHVPTILADHDYAAVSDGRPGDLAIYFNGTECTHSGIVRIDASGAVWIESKWGPFGVFFHPPQAQPFPGICRFYRSPRAGHAMTIRPR